MKYTLLSSTGLRWLWLALFVAAVDFMSKQWIMNLLTLHETKPLFPSLNLFYAHNYGAAFSFLSSKAGWSRWFFSGIAVGIILVLLVMMYRTLASRKCINIAYALILGGAFGNLFDRIYHGFVVDFIDFYVGSWHFATFNIADCAISIGAALVIFDSLFKGDHPLSENTAMQEQDSGNGGDKR